MFIENGRVINTTALPMMDGLRAIARVHRGTFRVAPNQNLTISEVEAAGPRGDRKAAE